MGRRSSSSFSRDSAVFLTQVLTLTGTDATFRIAALGYTLQRVMPRQRFRGFVSISALALVATATEPSDCSTPTSNLAQLDPSFGAGGISVFGGRTKADPLNGGAKAMAILPDDRIVVVGSTRGTYEPNDGVVAVLDADGNLDPSFGQDGVIVDPLDHSTYFGAVAVDAEGRIVVAGYTEEEDGPRGTAIVRYLQDGSRDPSFGVDPDLPGVTRIYEPCSVTPRDLAIQSDGSIVTTGAACPFTRKFSVLRLSVDGIPDASLGENGLLLLEDGNSADILVSSSTGNDVGILIGGTVASSAGLYDRDFSITRVATDGSPDTSFGDGGTVTTDFNDGAPGLVDQLNSLATTAGGRILAAGYKQLTVPVPNEPWDRTHDFLIAAYDSEGNVDESFGKSGSVLIEFGGDSDFGVEVLVRSNGNILVVGNAQPLQWDKELCIAHLRPNGEPAAEFYRTITSSESFGIGVRGAALDSQGRLVVAGSWYYDGGGWSYYVARYQFRDE